MLTRGPELPLLAFLFHRHSLSHLSMRLFSNLYLPYSDTDSTEILLILCQLAIKIFCTSSKLNNFQLCEINNKKFPPPFLLLGRGSGIKKSGSGINIPDPQHWPEQCFLHHPATWHPIEPNTGAAPIHYSRRTPQAYIAQDNRELSTLSGKTMEFTRCDQWSANPSLVSDQLAPQERNLIRGGGSGS